MRRIPALLMVLVVPIHAGPRVPSSVVCMVTDALGDVRLDHEAKVIDITREVEAGTSLNLKVGAKVTLLMYTSGEEVRLSGPGRFSFDLKGVVSGPKAAIHRIKGPGLNLKQALKPGGLAQASLVMRGPLEIDLEEPAQPVLRNPPTTFRWSGIQGVSSYAFSLRQTDGQVLYTTTTQTTMLKLPEGLKLESGVKYLWALSADLPGARTLHGEGALELLSQDRREILASLQQAASMDFSSRLIYATTLQVFGLISEAKTEWRALAVQRPEDFLLKSYAR